jgi:hypothetical protein
VFGAASLELSETSNRPSRIVVAPVDDVANLLTPYTGVFGCQCVSKCAEKFMKHTSRVSVRFQELSETMQGQLPDAVTGGAK